MSEIQLNIQKPLSANRPLQAYARRHQEREAAWAKENRYRQAMGFLPIERHGQSVTAFHRSQRERERMERLTQATNAYLRSMPEIFRRFSETAESAQESFERFAEVEIEPVHSPEILISRSTRDHLNEASGRISQVSRMDDLSEVVESYDRLRADTDRGQAVDADDLDKLFAEIDNLTKGDNSDGYRKTYEYLEIRLHF